VTALIKGPRGFGQSQSLSGDLLGFVMGYAVILVVVALVRPQQVLAFNLPTFLPLLLLGPFVGIACILLEYLVGILLLFLRTRKLVTRVAVHISYSRVSRIAIKDILSIRTHTPPVAIQLAGNRFRHGAVDRYFAMHGGLCDEPP
jgi:hypothetical protein